MHRHLQKIIWSAVLMIMGIGLLALYSATYGNVRVTQEVFYDQSLCALVGVGLMFILSRVDYRKFFDAAYIFYGLNVLLLLGVLAAGRYAMGAKRWMELGAFSFQPSELMKLALILALGRYFSNRRPSLSFNLRSRVGVVWGDLVCPFLMAALPMALVFKQPDLGTAFLIFGVFLVILFASGLEYRYLVWFMILCVSAVPVIWYFLKGYQKMRLLVFLNPNIDPLGAGYTIIQSKIAVGSGGLFGKGWLAGTQNQLNFLPERHTDFIFSVIGEEWGLVGTIVTIGCFFILAHSGLNIAQNQKDRFGMLVTAGIVAILTLQVVVNVGMVMGLFPVVGITLPLISYGRSSFMVFVLMVGFLLNLSKRRTVF